MQKIHNEHEPFEYTRSSWEDSVGFTMLVGVATMIFIGFCIYVAVSLVEVAIAIM